MDENKPDNSVEAARARAAGHRESRKTVDIDTSAQGLRAKIIEIFGAILWVALAMGVLSAAWSLLTFQIAEAVTTLITTIVTVGVGFVVLDIRDRMIR